MPKLALATIVAQDAIDAAPALLGCKLIHDSQEGTTSGIIVETEAYSQDDEASHSFGGPIARTQVMFGPPGYAYIYFTYGMHYCFNVVTGGEGNGQGVLIRALEPVSGLELMARRRFATAKQLPLLDKQLHDVSNGPAKLVQAMAITKADYGVNLLINGRLRLEAGTVPKHIVQTTRVGIRRAADAPRRFYIAGNPFVSRR